MTHELSILAREIERCDREIEAALTLCAAGWKRGWLITHEERREIRSAIRVANADRMRAIVRYCRLADAGRKLAKFPK